MNTHKVFDNLLNQYETHVGSPKFLYKIVESRFLVNAVIFSLVTRV